MPCTVTGSLLDDAELAGLEAREEAIKATRAACDLVRVIRKHKPELLKKGIVSFSTLEWIKHHDAIDARNKEVEKIERKRQQARAAALAKLTPEDRKALNIK